MVAIITNGAPITADTSIKANAIMGTCMAIAIPANGDPVTGDITVTAGAITAVAVDEDTRIPILHHASFGLRMDNPGHLQDECPGLSVKKLRHS